MTTGEILRGLRKLEPITIRELFEAIGAERPQTVHKALTQGIERGVVRRSLARKYGRAVYVYRTTALGRADCECGRPKEIDLGACDRCLYLDGDETLRGKVIEVLRGTDGMNLRELCEELGMNPDNSYGQRTLRRPLSELLDDGRIRRYWRENDSVPRLARVFGRSEEVEQSGAGGGWAYVLAGLTEREWRKSA